MNGMPEKLTALLEVACEAVRSGADVQQVIAVRTEKGNAYTLVRRDVSEKGRAEESRFVHRLAEAGGRTDYGPCLPLARRRAGRPVAAYGCFAAGDRCREQGGEGAAPGS